MVSPSAEQVAAARQRRQQQLARAAASVADEAWGQIDPSDIARSWAQLVDRALAAVAGAQEMAAASADAYVNAALAAQNLEAAETGSVVASRLAGIASDGRPLASLLYRPVIQTLQTIGAGATPARALQAGRLSLDMIVRTQVADAGRVAAGVGVTARGSGTGYVRQLSPPSCSRCAILAGRFYRWSSGFQRHPRCDCVNVPTTRAAWRASKRGTPEDYFVGLSRAEQDRIFTKAGAEAIRDGADMAKVVNARRGMYTAAGRMHTAESTTRRGIARPGRLMPEQIYLEARGDRDEALRLLRLHGYLT